MKAMMKATMKATSKSLMKGSGLISGHGFSDTDRSSKLECSFRGGAIFQKLILHPLR
jgi:hypothetical protein